MTAAKAAPDSNPNTATATAMASSKLLLAAVNDSVAVEDQDAVCPHEASDRIGQVARDLRHEAGVRRRRDPRDLRAPPRQVDQEEHVVGE
jgi:hypothetical protein